ncbi:MAG TPA: hypothetical protein VFZ08_16650 [Terriglobia bacterium]|nr:hypothetical protein [Terriglobia bacterium]
MPQTTKSEITYSLLEYASAFRRPIFGAPASLGQLIGSILDELAPSGYTLSGVEFNLQAPKLDEFAIVFRRTIPAFPPWSFALGFGKVNIKAENLDWTEAERFISTHRAALDAVRKKGGAELQSQQLDVGMHIQLKDRARKDVTSPLLSPFGAMLLDGEADFSGVVLTQGKVIFVIDASVGVANGLFVRISREHRPDASFEQLAETLHNDEKRIFDVLGLEGIL